MKVSWLALQWAFPCAFRNDSRAVGHGTYLFPAGWQTPLGAQLVRSTQHVQNKTHIVSLRASKSSDFLSQLQPDSRCNEHVKARISSAQMFVFTPSSSPLPPRLSTLLPNT